MLVHYERFSHIDEAIWREKRLKTWNRAWKVRLIEASNPDWRDLYDTLAL
jgi:putative endonuclease